MITDAAAVRAVLLQIAQEVQSRGWFPPTQDFRTQENHKLLDEMVREKILIRSHGFYAWRGYGLRRIKHDGFGSAELDRAVRLLQFMTERFNNKEREQVSVYDLARLLGWPEPNEVRRAAYVLMMEFGNALFATQMRENGVPEMIQPGEGLWSATMDLLVNGPPPEPETPKEEPKVVPMGSNPPDPKRVFIVYGRNAAAADAMRAFLRSLTLIPGDFDEVKRRMGGTPFIGDVIRKGVEEAAAVVVIFTPDERATLRPGFERDGDPPLDKERWQARPNVIFEAGLAMGIDEHKTILVTLGSDVSLFSDASGRHILRMNNTFERRDELRELLETAGCDVQSQPDWTRSGDFQGCVSPSVPLSPSFPGPAGAQDTPTASPRSAAPAQEMDDDRRIMLLKRWLRSVRASEINDMPQDCAEIERAAEVPPDSAARLYKRWVDGPWTVDEIRGGFITLRYGGNVRKPRGGRS